MLASDPPAAHWPHEGAISFVDVSVVYRPGLPPAVVSFSAELRARERAAVVGRTGAGKSTLVPAALPWAGPMACTLQRTMQHAMYPSRLRHAPCTAPCVPQVLALFQLTVYIVYLPWLYGLLTVAGARALPADGVQRPHPHRRTRAAVRRPRARAQVRHDHPAGTRAALGHGGAQPRPLREHC